MAENKRGRGRPKKTPPVIMINVSLTKDEALAVMNAINRCSYLEKEVGIEQEDQQQRSWVHDRIFRKWVYANDPDRWSDLTEDQLKNMGLI